MKPLKEGLDAWSHVDLKSKTRNEQGGPAFFLEKSTRQEGETGR